MQFESNHPHKKSCLVLFPGLYQTYSDTYYKLVSMFAPIQSLITRAWWAGSDCPGLCYITGAVMKAINIPILDRYFFRSSQWRAFWKRRRRGDGLGTQRAPTLIVFLTAKATIWESISLKRKIIWSSCWVRKQ